MLVERFNKEYPKIGKFLEGVLVHYQLDEGGLREVILRKYGEYECEVASKIEPLNTRKVPTIKLFVIGRI